MKHGPATDATRQQQNPSCGRVSEPLSSRCSSGARPDLWRRAAGKPIRWPQRCLLAALGLALSVLLSVAVMLEPNRRGFGTHEQLGLPPCTFVVLFEERCPSCGMTTSWSHLVRGNVTAAVAANPGGAMLCVLAMVSTPWLLASAVRGRWLVGVPSDAAWFAAGGLVVTTSILHWLWLSWMR